MIDPYASHTPYMGGPSQRFFKIVPSDTADLEFLTCGIYVGNGGDITVRNIRGQTVTFKNVASGGGIPIRAARVLATGTTATDIVGLA